MDLDERIARRRRASRRSGLVAEWRALDPSAHVDEPIGRGAALERLLDALDPVFEGGLPADAYVYGPAGAGKSALVAALFDRLRAQFDRGDVIRTTTRASAGPRVAFAYVDARRHATAFRLYGAVGEALVSTGMPERGVGTDELRERVGEAVAARDAVVVAVDHVDEPGSVPLSTLAETVGTLDGASWLAVGRSHPDSVSGARPAASVHVAAYRSPALEDVLSTRASRGLRNGLDHDVARRIAAWADGNAHDALAATFGAADAALSAGRSSLRSGDVDAGIRAVPRDGAPTSRVLSLSENRKCVLDALLAVPTGTTTTIADAAEAVAARTDLSNTTVTRYLYELAEEGVLSRVPSERPDADRRPSRVVPRFPTRVYRRLRANAGAEAVS